MSAEAERTLEANPNSLTGTRLSLIRELGINRLSLGMQSFSDQLLVSLGRLHSGRQAEAAFKAARAAGFRNISIDLIYGIPGQTEALWRRTLEKALTLQPEHISLYALSLEEGTRFMTEARTGRFSLPDDEATASQYEFAVVFLHSAGYEHYEISNFSLPGFACKHNLNYWERGEYLGLGPGAWSFIGGKRFSTMPDVKEYGVRLSSGSSVISDEETVDTRQAANETLLLGLRTTRGLDLAAFGAEYGHDFMNRVKRTAAPLEVSGLLEQVKGRLRLTRRGFLLANEVLINLCL